MIERFTGYVPKDIDQAQINVESYLAPVVARIGEVLPSELIWELFTSTKNETGGVITFPYCRVDSALAVIDMSLYLMRSDNQREKRKRYQLACKLVFTILVWVEIGFQGLEKLANSQASVNWTGGVGHFVNDKERATGIITKSREIYLRNIKEFVTYRRSAGIKNDYFSKYGVEYLLDRLEE